MRSLTEGNALLSKAVVDSLDDQSNGRYRFGADWKPFTHQLASWKALLEKKHSVVDLQRRSGTFIRSCR